MPAPEITQVNVITMRLAARYHHVHVDDRLGIQAGNRSAADVLGHMRNVGQHDANAVMQLQEQDRPPSIAQAVAATGPARAARLLADAERIASAINDESSNALALTEIAQALLAIA